MPQRASRASSSPGRTALRKTPGFPWLRLSTPVTWPIQRQSKKCWWLVIVMSISFPRKSKNFEKQKEFLSKNHILSVLSILDFLLRGFEVPVWINPKPVAFKGFTDFVTFQSNFSKKDVGMWWLEWVVPYMIRNLIDSTFHWVNTQ